MSNCSKQNQYSDISPGTETEVYQRSCSVASHPVDLASHRTDRENYDAVEGLDTSSSGGGSIDDFEQLDDVEQAVELQIAEERARESPIHSFSTLPMITAHCGIFNNNTGRNTSGSSTTTIDSGCALSGVESDSNSLISQSNSIVPMFNKDLNEKLLQITPNGNLHSGYMMQKTSDDVAIVLASSSEDSRHNNGRNLNAGDEHCAQLQRVSNTTAMKAADSNGRKERFENSNSPSQLPVDLTLVDPNVS